MHGDYKTDALLRFKFLKTAILSLVTLSVERFLWLLKKYWYDDTLQKRWYGIMMDMTAQASFT